MKQFTRITHLVKCACWYLGYGTLNLASQSPKHDQTAWITLRYITTVFERFGNITLLRRSSEDDLARKYNQFVVIQLCPNLYI